MNYDDFLYWITRWYVLKAFSRLANKTSNQPHFTRADQHVNDDGDELWNLIPDDNTLSPLQEQLAKQRQAEVQYALDGLSNYHREILMLHNATNLSLRNIAQHVGCSHTKVRNDLNLATNHFKALYNARIKDAP